MLAYLFVVLAVAAHIRWIALPFSFTPVFAALLYFGARMPRRQLWLPVALLAVSDVYLTRVIYGYSLGVDQVVVWAFYAALILLGGALIKGFSPLRIGVSSLACSVSFFLISNFTVWFAGSMYPRTFNGLMACYVAAVPFFRNAVVSDLLFSAVFFGTGYLVSHRTAAQQTMAASGR
ncbi:MAG TPA: DUF6580 family putative transport protein [Bryocella sp.]|nr:DUF6580 family putative transport protein [Bryocella sp.]